MKTHRAKLREEAAAVEGAAAEVGALRKRVEELEAAAKRDAARLRKARAATERVAELEEQVAALTAERDEARAQLAATTTTNGPATGGGEGA